VGELANSYFSPSAEGRAYFYKVDRPGLKDTLGVRRKMVDLFKSAYMGEHERVDFTKWLALENHGYCFAPSGVEGENGAMAMDVISQDGLVMGVVVGPVHSCADTKVDREFVHRFPPPSKGQGMGGGC